MDKLLPLYLHIIAQKENKQVSKIDGITNGMSALEKNEAGEGDKESGMRQILALVKKLSETNFQIYVWFSCMIL